MKFSEIEEAFDFVSSGAPSEQVLPDDFREVAGMFQRRGANGRFKRLLERRGKLDAWYEFEGESQRKKLRSWCAANDIELED